MSTRDLSSLRVYQLTFLCVIVIVFTLKPTRLTVFVNMVNSISGLLTKTNWSLSKKLLAEVTKIVTDHL